MSNIPDFVMQIEEVERNLKAQWQLTNMNWNDRVAVKYKEGVFDAYCKFFERYITGEDIRGYGVDDLMKKMNEHLEKMAELTGVSPDVAFACAAGPQHGLLVEADNGRMIPVEDLEIVKNRGGIVHDERRDRDYWDENQHGVKPGEMHGGAMKEFFDNKGGVNLLAGGGGDCGNGGKNKIPWPPKPDGGRDPNEREYPHQGIINEQAEQAEQAKIKALEEATKKLKALSEQKKAAEIAKNIRNMGR